MNVFFPVNRTDLSAFINPARLPNAYFLLRVRELLVHSLLKEGGLFLLE